MPQQAVVPGREESRQDRRQARHYNNRIGSMCTIFIGRRLERAEGSSKRSRIDHQLWYRETLRLWYHAHTYYAVHRAASGGHNEVRA